MDGKYLIGIYTLRPIAEGEEITFDYNSVTEVSTIPCSVRSCYMLNCSILCLHNYVARVKKSTKHRSASVGVRYAGAAI